MFSQKKSICYFVESSYLNFMFKISTLYSFKLIKSHTEFYSIEYGLFYCGRK